jgi:hypothetical protein
VAGTLFAEEKEMNDQMVWICIALTGMLVTAILMCIIPFIVDMWFDMIDDIKNRRKSDGD